MKKILIFISLFFIIFFFPGRVTAVTYPDYVGLVNDFADIYSTQFEKNLEDKLANFEKETTNEIAVASIKSLEGESVEEYAVRLFEKWQIGKEKEDNGLLLLLVIDEREVRIEVGYGLEPYITDGRAGDIIRQDIVPEFKKSNYEAGTDKAVNSLIKYIGTKDIAPQNEPESKSDFPVWAILLGFYFFATYFSSFLGRTKAIWPGGLIGGIIGVIIGLILSSLLASVFIGIFAGLFGLFLDFILSRNFKIRKDKGLPTSFWSSGGGFRSGSGGGSSFGGFGGGSSGGGGASGRW